MIRNSINIEVQQNLGFNKTRKDSKKNHLQIISIGRVNFTTIHKYFPKINKEIRKILAFWIRRSGRSSFRKGDSIFTCF